MTTLPILFLIATAPPVLPDLSDLHRRGEYTTIGEWVDRVAEASVDPSTGDQILRHAHLDQVQFPVVVRGGLAERVGSVGPVTDMHLGETGLVGEILVSSSDWPLAEPGLTCVGSDQAVLDAELALTGPVESRGSMIHRLEIGGLVSCFTAGGIRLMVHDTSEAPARLVDGDLRVVFSMEVGEPEPVEETVGIARLIGTSGEGDVEDIAALFGTTEMGSEIEELLSGGTGFEGVEGGVVGGVVGGIGGGGWGREVESLSTVSVASGGGLYRVVLDGDLGRQGPLSADDVRSRLAPRLDQFGTCPAGGLAGDLSAPGWLPVEVIIESDGTVGAMDLPADVGDGALHACVTGVLAGTSFPAAAETTRVDLRLGFVTRE